MIQSKHNNVELIIIEILLVNSFFVGEGYSRIFDISQTDAWISMILGTLLGIIIIYIFHILGKRINYNLKYLTNKHFLLKILLDIFLLILIIYPIIMIDSLVNSYYLTYTNPYLIIIPIVLLVLYLAIKGFRVISKTMTFIMPIIIITIVMGFIGLSTLVKIDNYLPTLIIPTKKILLGSLYFCIFSTSPLFLIIQEKADFKPKMVGYLLGCALVIILTGLVTGVLGNYFATLYSFPVYMAYKKINIFSFLQNLENILYMPSYIHAITLSSISLAKILELHQNKILPFLLCIVTIIFVNYVSTHYNAYLMLSKIIPYILASFITILIFTILILSNKKTRSI